jgi:predicted TIM-barrel enzyme
MEESMDEDRFNMDIRKFLKVVGVTSQREIELAVRNAFEKGMLARSAVLKPRMTLRIPEIGLEHVIDGEIGVG